MTNDDVAHQAIDELHALRDLVVSLRDQLTNIEAEAKAARDEAHQAREEVLRLRDQVAAAERDQQDLRASRAQLDRLQVRGLLARIMNRR